MARILISKISHGGSSPSTPAILSKYEIEWILEWPSEDVVDFNAIKFRMGVQNGNAAGC